MSSPSDTNGSAFERNKCNGTNCGRIGLFMIKMDYDHHIHVDLPNYIHWAYKDGSPKPGWDCARINVPYFLEGEELELELQRRDLVSVDYNNLPLIYKRTDVTPVNFMRMRQNIPVMSPFSHDECKRKCDNE